jgi:LPXTG-motif cell wall-anchored protein
VYNGVTIPVNGSVSKTFKVRVKYNLPANLSYQLVNTYGNTVRINIVGSQVTGPIIAPKTGVDTQTAAGFGGIITLAAAMVIKRKTVLGFILNK